MNTVVDKVENMSSKSYDVFISYRRACGATVARMLQVLLQAENMSCFFDRDSIGPEHYLNCIDVALHNSENYVLIVTPQIFSVGAEKTIENDVLVREIKMALDLEGKGKLRFAPLFVNGSEGWPSNTPSELIAMGLDKRNGKILRHDNFKSEFDGFVSDLRTRFFLLTEGMERVISDDYADSIFQLTKAINNMAAIMGGDNSKNDVARVTMKLTEVVRHEWRNNKHDRQFLLASLKALDKESLVSLAVKLGFTKDGQRPSRIAGGSEFIINRIVGWAHGKDSQSIDVDDSNYGRDFIPSEEGVIACLRLSELAKVCKKYSCNEALKYYCSHEMSHLLSHVDRRNALLFLDIFQRISLGALLVNSYIFEKGDVAAIEKIHSEIKRDNPKEIDDCSKLLKEILGDNDKYRQRLYFGDVLDVDSAEKITERTKKIKQLILFANYADIEWSR